MENKQTPDNAGSKPPAQAPANQPADSQPLQQTTSPQPMPSQNNTQNGDSANNKPSSDKAKLYTILVAVVVLLIGVSIATYIFFFSPAALSQRAANEFINAASEGDSVALIEITDETSKDGKQFLEQVASAVEGDSELKDKTSENDKFYFLYKLSGAEKNFVRLVVEKQDGKWMVSSVVFSDNELALIPGDTVDTEEAVATESTPEATPTTTTPATPTLSCLTQDDYKWFFYDKKPSTIVYNDTYNPDTYTSNAQGSMFFEPDSIVETSFASIYDDWSDFSSNNKSKQWKFRLLGSVYLAGGSTYANPSSVEFSNKRANEVKRELMTRGVPEDRISIDPPIEHQNEYIDDSQSAEIYRRVTVVIDPTCNTTTSPSTGL